MTNLLSAVNENVNTFNKALLTRTNVMSHSHKIAKRLRGVFKNQVSYRAILKQALISLYATIKAEESAKIVVQNVCVSTNGFLQSVASELTLTEFGMMQIATNKQYYIELRKCGKVKSMFLFEKEQITSDMINCMFA